MIIKEIMNDIIILLSIVSILYFITSGDAASFIRHLESTIKINIEERKSVDDCLPNSHYIYCSNPKITL